jgi:DNA-binding LytR/AlgR family response regulator
MKVLIIEDEAPASRQLQRLINTFDASIEVLDVIDSVEGAVKWLRTFKHPDLLFLDIQLADGVSFDIFMQTEVTAPVIFTTAYDQYTLKAFKLNSVDYLLKPIEPEEFNLAMHKYLKYFQHPQNYDRGAIERLLQAMRKPDFKERLLIKTGQTLTYIQVSEVAYFIAEQGVIMAITRDGKKHLVDQTLEQLENMLDPKCFFRISRKLLIHIESIKKIHPHFNGRLKLELLQAQHLDESYVSRERAPDFKAWLNN